MRRPTKIRRIDGNRMETRSMSKKKSAVEFNINDLPEEIIACIFSNLPLSERKNARMVSRRWHRLSYSFGLIQNDVTLLHENFNLMKTPSSCSQHINIHLLMFQVDTKYFSILCNSRSFWQNHCQNLRSLDIQIGICNIFKLLSRILFFCPHLENIYVDVVNDSSYRHSLPKSFTKRVHFLSLRSLSLSGNSDFVVPMLKVALMKAPKLVRISVNCERLPHTPGIDQPLLSLNCRPASNLEEIYLSGDSINYRFLADINVIFSNKLERLTLNMCPRNRVSHTDLQGITGRCNNLKHLILDSICCYDFPYFFPLSSIDSLTSLSLGRNMNLADNMVALVSAFDNLAHLNLFFNSNLTHTGIEEVFGRRVRPEMQELRMDNMTYVSDYHDVIVRILPNLPNLKILYLSKLKITKQLLEAIMTHNTSLECLTLKGRYNERPPYALLSTNRMAKLTFLDIYNTNIPKTIVENLDLPSLKFLFCKFKNCRPKGVNSLMQVKRKYCWIFYDHFDIFYMKNCRRLLPCCKSSFVYCCRP